MARHVDDPNDLSAEVRWHRHPTGGAYVRVTMRDRRTGAFLAEAHQDEPCWWDRASQVAAENKAMNFAARVALGLL